MAKLTNVRERVHQPFRDALIRTGGLAAGSVQDRTDLFVGAARDIGSTNLPTGATLPSDQSHVTLVLRCLLWFRGPVARSAATLTTSTGRNGDFFITGANEANAVTALNSSVPGDVRDVHRLYWQSAEQLYWSFGYGEKDSIKQMPSSYFPWGGGLHGDIGGATDLILWNNGLPSQEAILRLGRAVLGPPRQQIRCQATIQALPDGGNRALFGVDQGTRNMLSLRDNLNAVDLIKKVIAFSFDGLWSRDVQ